MEEKLWHQHKWSPEIPYELSYPVMPVQHLVENPAREHPHAPFVLFDDTTLSYRQVDMAANRIAHFLRASGIEPGDRVLICLPNIPHFVVALFGVFKAGAVAVTCNPTSTIDELRFYFKDAAARCAFVLDHPGYYPTVCTASEGTHLKTIVYCNIGTYLPPLKRLLGRLLDRLPHAETHDPTHIPFDRALAGQPTTPLPLEVDPQEQIAFIQYTGGTTGQPKGACLTHYNVTSNLCTASVWVRPGEDAKHSRPLRIGGECFMGVLPWYHSYGMMMTLLAATWLRSSVVCVPDPRAGNPPFTAVLKLVQKHHATVFNGVPTIFSTIINHPLADQVNLHSLMLCGCGAAPLPVEVAHEFEARTGAILYEAYGLTETATIVLCNPTNRRDRKLGTLGLPIPSTDVKIVDLDTGLQELAQGEDGEIAVCGPQVMTGYWQRPEADEQVFRTIDGRRFLLTGDIGHMDEEGFFVLSDRKKDIVYIGGFKAYPREIEEVLHTHPKVRLAAVIGIPDERMGQALKAYLVLKDGETATRNEIIHFCKQHLIWYKVPRKIEFRDTLPTSQIGKVLKRKLQST